MSCLRKGRVIAPFSLPYQNDSVASRLSCRVHLLAPTARLIGRGAQEMNNGGLALDAKEDSWLVTSSSSSWLHSPANHDLTYRISCRSGCFSILTEEMPVSDSKSQKVTHLPGGGGSSGALLQHAAHVAREQLRNLRNV